MHLKTITSAGPPLNNASSVHPPPIHESSSTTTSKPDKPRPVHKEPNSSIPMTQVATTADQRPSRFNAAVDSMVNGKTTKEHSTNEKSSKNSKRPGSVGKSSKAESKSASVQSKTTSNPVYFVDQTYATSLYQSSPTTGESQYAPDASVTSVSISDSCE